MTYFTAPFFKRLSKYNVEHELSIIQKNNRMEYFLGTIIIHFDGSVIVADNSADTFQA